MQHPYNKLMCNEVFDPIREHLLYEKPIEIHKPGKGVIIRGNSLIPECLATKFASGIDVTDRSLSQVFDLLGHQAKWDLIYSPDLIVFLGNGLSTAALELNLLQRNLGLKPNQKLLVDAIDIYTVHQQLQSHLDQMSFKDLSPQLSQFLAKTKALVKAQRQGEVILLQLVIGQDQIPERHLHQAGTIVNVYGPSEKTLNQQLLFLKENGHLYTDFTTEVSTTVPVLLGLAPLMA